VRARVRVRGRPFASLLHRVSEGEGGWMCEGVLVARMQDDNLYLCLYLSYHDHCCLCGSVLSLETSSYSAVHLSVLDCGLNGYHYNHYNHYNHVVRDTDMSYMYFRAARRMGPEK
jgi:hypothetical protein